MRLSLAWKVFALIAVLVIGGRLYVLQSTDPDSIRQQRADDTKTADTSGDLFRALWENKLLALSPAGLLTLPAADQALAAAQASGKTPAYAGLLEALYAKAQGKEVQKQVALWNLGHRLAAIRDNRSGSSDSNLWKVSDQTTGRMLDSLGLLPAEFVYVGGETLRAGFHDWRTSHSRKGNPLLFTTEIQNQGSKPLNWQIQIIGSVDEAALRRRFSAYQPKLEARRPKDTCADVPVQAWELTLTLPPSKQPLPIEIPVQMASTSLTRLEGVAICMTAPDATLAAGETDLCLAKPPQQRQEDKASSDEPADKETEGLMPTPAATQAAPAPPPPAECRRPNLAQHQLHWQADRLYVRTLGQQPSGDRPTYTLYTLDGLQQNKPFGVALTEALTPASATPPQVANLSSGSPTAAAESLGLLPLIGQDRHDRYALSGILNASRLQDKHTDVYLTLHSEMQKIAQQTLQQWVKKQNPHAAGALVLLNPKTGAILAAAHVSPQTLPRHVHHWDRNAFSQIYPTQDPTQFNPWQGETGFNAPGSTFKLLTALAGLSAIRDGHPDRKRLEQMMEGVKQADFAAVTGLNPNAADFSHPALSNPIRNFHAMPLSTAFKPPTHTVGLREALRDSVNNWFMQLVFNMDYTTQPAQDKDADGLPDLQLATTAKWLGFQGYYTNLAPKDLKLAQIPAGNGGRGDVLNAFGGRMGIQAMQPGGKIPLGPLVQNSIGQDMASSPLQMAKLSASIATGKNVQPHLFAWWNDDDLYEDSFYPAFEDLDFPHLDWLHQGMKAVVDAGTARGQFGKQLAPHVYGKTGTAQAKPRGENMQDVAWFTGFYTQGQPEEATLAFACQITRANSGGGKVCAPAIRDLLNALEKAQLLESAHAQ
ncbi:MAG: penicillin-binding transpeptidase domain-containing protein [Thiolinea sp.]